jgi:hypothetical protein
MGIPAILLVFTLALAGCSTDVEDEPEPDPDPVYTAPVLSAGPAVSYGTDGKVSVAFTFDKAVTVDEGANWDFALSNDGKTVTVTPKGSLTGKQTLTFTAKNADDATKTLLVGTYSVIAAVSADTFARPTDEPVTYTVEYVYDNGVVVKDSGGVWHYAVKNNTTGIYDIADAVYTPNKDVPGAVELFEIELASEATNDTIYLASSPEEDGKDVPKKTGSSNVFIHIGKPGSVDNSGLPPFAIAPGKLGKGTGDSDYVGTILQVNKGAYLDIESDQTFASAFGNETTTYTIGKFTGGSVYVEAGGKVRDSAYKGWPLGAGSTFTVKKGGFLTTGPGDKTGAARTSGNIDETTDSATQSIITAYFDGWLIGDGAGGNGTDAPVIKINLTDGFIGVNNTSVLLDGEATVQQPVSLFYDIWLAAASELTVNKDLTFVYGTNDNQNTAKAIYGQDGAEIVLAANTKITSEDTNTNILGGSTGQEVNTAGTWTIKVEGDTSDSTFDDYDSFYTDWELEE